MSLNYQGMVIFDFILDFTVHNSLIIEFISFSKVLFDLEVQ